MSDLDRDDGLQRNLVRQFHLLVWRDAGSLLWKRHLRAEHGRYRLADNFRYNSGFGNPALHNASNRTLLATGMVFGFTRYASEGGKSFVDDALDLPYLSLSVPVKNTDWACRSTRIPRAW